MGHDHDETRAIRTNSRPRAIDDATKLLRAWGGDQATDTAATEQICQLVGGLPLAVRLAGRYLAQTSETSVEYLAWLKQLPGKPVFVAYPAAYDFLFVYWYLIRFSGESPFSHSALDIKTYAMAVLQREYRDTTKGNMPKRWFDDLPHPHCALDDAIEQGALFCNMLAENLNPTIR